MKLSSDEGRALAFVLGLIALAAIARVATRPDPRAVPAAAEVDAAALEEQSDSALRRDRALARPLTADERIDVNAASADELDRLPGVGPALAARLVAERERGGAYDSAADLRAVSGMGAALLTRLAPHLSFGPGEGLARRVAAEPASDDGQLAGLPNGASSATAAAEAGEAGDRPRRSQRTRSATGAATASEPLSPSPLDLNRASAAELDALPGIGPGLAARIVAKRDSLHGFRSVDDLLEVRGIGPATLRRLKPLLRS